MRPGPPPSPSGRSFYPGICPYVQGLPLGGPWSWDIEPQSASAEASVTVVAARGVGSAGGSLRVFAVPSCRLDSALLDIYGPGSVSPVSSSLSPAGEHVPTHSVLILALWSYSVFKCVHLGVVCVPYQTGSSRTWHLAVVAPCIPVPGTWLAQSSCSVSTGRKGDGGRNKEGKRKGLCGR